MDRAPVPARTEFAPSRAVSEQQSKLKNLVHNAVNADDENSIQANKLCVRQKTSGHLMTHPTSHQEGIQVRLRFKLAPPSVDRVLRETWQ